MSRTGGIMKDIHTYRIQDNNWEVDYYTNSKGGDGYSIRCIKTDQP